MSRPSLTGQLLFWLVLLLALTLTVAVSLVAVLNYTPTVGIGS